MANDFDFPEVPVFDGVDVIHDEVGFATFVAAKAVINFGTDFLLKGIPGGTAVSTALEVVNQVNNGLLNYGLFATATGDQPGSSDLAQAGIAIGISLWGYIAGWSALYTGGATTVVLVVLTEYGEMQEEMGWNTDPSDWRSPFPKIPASEMDITERYLQREYEKNVITRAIDKFVNGMALDDEETQLLVKATATAISMQGGPAGYDSSDPRGPWQIPGAPGDRTGPNSQLNVPSGTLGGPTQSGWSDSQGGGVSPRPGGSEGAEQRMQSGGGTRTGNDRDAPTSTRSGGALADERREGNATGTRTTTAQPSQSQQSSSHNQSNNRDRQGSGDRTATEGRRPIILDLDGDGIQITELSRSTRFMDGGEGLLHRTAWAAAGNGVLFFDPDGRNAITEERQYVFTKWNPTAAGDLEALRSVWDSNGDGKLTAADAEFAKFKVLVTNADGSTTVMTLTQVGMTSINLTADATNIVLPVGSVITGQTVFTRGDGTTGTVANTGSAGVRRGPMRPAMRMRALNCKLHLTHTAPARFAHLMGMG
jgi:hypothetical protein